MLLDNLFFYNVSNGNKGQQKINLEFIQSPKYIIKKYVYCLFLSHDLKLFSFLTRLGLSVCTILKL